MFRRSTTLGPQELQVFYAEDLGFDGVLLLHPDLGKILYLAAERQQEAERIISEASDIAKRAADSTKVWIRSEEGTWCWVGLNAALADSLVPVNLDEEAAPSLLIAFLRVCAILLRDEVKSVEQLTRHVHDLQWQGKGSAEPITTPPVRGEFQRAHESQKQTQKRLLRKYGQEAFIRTAIEVYEEAKGGLASPKDVPVKFINLDQAAQELDIPNRTIVRWVADGLLHNVGKWEYPAQPERGVILVNPHEVQKLKEKLEAGEEGAEPKLLTLQEAAETHNLPYGTLRSWHRRGHLPVKGREVFHTHGGGKILVDERDVIRLKNRWTPKGRKTTD